MERELKAGSSFLAGTCKFEVRLYSESREAFEFGGIFGWGEHLPNASSGWAFG